MAKDLLRLAAELRMSQKDIRRTLVVVFVALGYRVRNDAALLFMPIGE